MSKTNSLPHFLRDFHDQKDFIKAFWSWLEMMDNIQVQKGVKFDGVMRQRRTNTASWVAFHVLFISAIDFLHSLGYRLQKIDSSGDEINKNIEDLKDLPFIFESCRDPNALLAMNPEYCHEVLSRWKNWIPYMPPEAKIFMDNWEVSHQLDQEQNYPATSLTCSE